MTLPDDLPLNKARGWLLAADHPERRDALVGCTLDDAVSDAEWLIDAVVGTTLHLLDVDDEDGERTATRDLARLSADAVILLPDDLPTAQASLLAEAVARTETPKERASRELIEAMGLDVDQLGGPLWVGRIAAVASATEDAVAIPAQALMAVHNHLLLTRNYRPATQLFEAVAVDDPMPSTRARGRLYAAIHWQRLNRSERALESIAPLIKGHRHVAQGLLAEVLVLRADCLCDVGQWADADKAIRWAWAVDQSKAASAVFERLRKEQP